MAKAQQALSAVDEQMEGQTEPAAATTPPMPKNLRAKMAAVMGELGYIKKRGRNTFSNYDYVMAADVAAECAKLMAKHGVAFAATEESVEWPEPRTSAKGGALYVCRVRMKFIFLDTESDERIEVVQTSQATDSSDKDIFKAKTGALKYALVQTFLIATGDDPEDDTDDKKTGGHAPPEATFQTKEEKERKLKLTPDGKTVAVEQLAKLTELIAQVGDESTESGILTYYSVDNLKKMNPAQADGAIAILTKRLAKRAQS